MPAATEGPATGGEDVAERIGFIGAGLMGHGVAKNILEKGYPLAVLAHRNRKPVDDLIARGAREAVSAADLARTSDILFTCVSDSAVLDRVVYGESGVLAGAREGLVLIDLTTADPGATRRVAADLAARGVRMLDAPMTLTPKEAEEGTLNLLVGGDAALVERVRPVLATFTRQIFYVGPLGSAHTLKLVNNFLSQGTNALVIEAIVAALKAGVDPVMMRDVISVSGGNSVPFQRLVRFVTGEEPGGGGAFAIRNALKDVDYFVRLAEAEGAHNALGEAVRQFYRLAVALGYGDEMIPKLFDLKERLAGPPASTDLTTGRTTVAGPESGRAEP
jgi:3-hydroxyisobutyrate dehydrogenase-like beta-hydroxyacid dehydrogenase